MQSKPMTRSVAHSVVAAAAALASPFLDHSAHAGVALPIQPQSSPIAISHDDSLVVNVNPDGGSITAFDVVGNELKKRFSLKVGGEPSSVAIDPTAARAFVSLSLDGQVAVVDLVHEKVVTKLSVGSEPTAVLLSPNGTRLYVACATANDVLVFNAAATIPTIVGVVDLATFGTSPRSMTMTNDGDADDTDETLYVPLFFAELRSGKTSLDEGQDDAKEGRVIAISAATNGVLSAPNPILLAPMASTGFNSNGKLAPASGTTPAVASTNPQTFTTPTGAFPNQLAAIAIQPGANFAYVVSTGASPNGPLRFNSMAQGLLSVFNTSTRLEITATQTDPNVRRTAPLNLNQGINLATTPAPRLFLTNPVAIAWRADGSDAWVAVQQANVIVRITVDANGVPTIGAPLVAGPSSIVRVDLEAVTGTQIAGKAPHGIVLNGAGTRAYVSNLVSRSVSVIDIGNATAPTLLSTAKSQKLPKAGTDDAVIALGQELFYAGRGPEDRMSAEAWGGCIVCHPNGRSDNVTWMFDTGPRQTIALDGMFPEFKDSKQRILNWSGVRDENQDFELNTRGVFGGRGLIEDDRLFLALGGAFGAGPTDFGGVEQFDQSTGTVTNSNSLKDDAALANLAIARRDFATATLTDDRVFLFGGRAGSGNGSLVTGTGAVVEFNPRKNKYKNKSTSGFTPRHSLGAAVVETAAGPRIYVIGGYSSTSSSASPVNTVEEYDPDSNTWRTVASLPTAVAQFGITVAGGINTAEPLQLVHVVSGNTGSEGTPSLTNTNPVQRFQADPVGPGTWTGFNPAGLTLRRSHGSATALRGASSRVFVVGGVNAAGTVLDTVEEYLAQAVTLVATTHTAMPAARAQFGIAATTSTNQIYVVGGVDGTGTEFGTIFEYTINNNGAVAGPAGTPSGSWVLKGNLFEGRRGLQLSSPPGVTNFLTAKNSGRDARADAISKWIAAKVRPARAPLAQDDLNVLAGKTLFQQEGLIVPGVSCSTCHGGAKWTRSTVDYAQPPSPEIGLGFGNERVIGAELRQTKKQGPNVLNNVGTFTTTGRTNEIRFNAADISQAIAPLGANGFNIPSLLSVNETGPYFYSGLATTLDAVLDGSLDNNGGTRHHFVADPTQRANLIAFLRSIDAETKPFK